MPIRTQRSVIQDCRTRNVGPGDAVFQADPHPRDRRLPSREREQRETSQPMRPDVPQACSGSPSGRAQEAGRAAGFKGTSF